LTNNVCPVIWLAASEARKTTTLAISSGLAIRPSGTSAESSRIRASLCYEVSDRNTPGGGVAENERFIKKVGRGDGQAAAPERGHVHDVVSDETDLLEAQPPAARNLFDAGSLRRNLLMDLDEVQLLGAREDRVRAAAGDDAELEAPVLSDPHREAVARVPEAIYFFNLCLALFQEGRFGEALTACNAVDSNAPSKQLKAKNAKMMARIKDEAKAQGLAIEPTK